MAAIEQSAQIFLDACNLFYKAASEKSSDKLVKAYNKFSDLLECSDAGLTALEKEQLINKKSFAQRFITKYNYLVADEKRSVVCDVSNFIDHLIAHMLRGEDRPASIAHYFLEKPLQDFLNSHDIRQIIRYAKDVNAMAQKVVTAFGDNELLNSILNRVDVILLKNYYRLTNENFPPGIHRRDSKLIARLMQESVQVVGVEGKSAKPVEAPFATVVHENTSVATKRDDAANEERFGKKVFNLACTLYQRFIEQQTAQAPGGLELPQLVPDAEVPA